MLWWNRCEISDKKYTQKNYGPNKFVKKHKVLYIQNIHLLVWKVAIVRLEQQSNKLVALEWVEQM